MNSDESSLDRGFVAYLKEIQKGYVTLPKPHRIRVEKWVAKLSSAGGNATWRRNRNIYAKVLLNMVATKSLAEPFDMPPADGPLSTFPSHVLARFSKDLLGPHETGFWRELYRQIEGKPTVSTNLNDKTFIAGSDVPVTGNDRDVAGLRVLVREQATRIELLEQQLRNERVQFELNIQRCQHAHRLEIARLQENAQSLDNLSISQHNASNTSQAIAKSSGGIDSVSRVSSSLSVGQNLLSRALEASSVGFQESAWSPERRTSHRNSDGISLGVSLTNDVADGRSATQPDETPSSPTIHRRHSEPNVAKPQKHQDFLAYLEGFQAELRSLRR